MIAARAPVVIFFAALTLTYLALSPFSVRQMGYTSEQVEAARGMLTMFSGIVRGELSTAALTWPRHGLLEPLFQLPFVLVGQLAFGPSSAGEDAVLSMLSILASALLCSIVFVWVGRITGSRRWSVTLATAAAFTTIIWPYAYIGLETTQSLFLMAAAYLALADRTRASWAHTLLFAVSAGVAIGVKANGLALAPAVLFLIAARGRTNRRPADTIVTLVIVIAIFVLNDYWRTLAPSRAVGRGVLFGLFRVDSLSAALLNALYLLVAPNKGLFIYCPVLVAAVASLRAAWRQNAQIVIFSVLTLVGLIAGSSLFVFWADETWGARYLHAAIAPLIVCLGLAKRGVPMRFRNEAPLVASMLFGAFVSSLGVLFYYGTGSLAATAAGQTTLEDIQHDPEWNPIRLHAMLLKVLVRGPEAGPAPWPPPRHRWFPAPGESFAFQPSGTIDLRPYAAPQPYLLRRLLD